MGPFGAPGFAKKDPPRQKIGRRATALSAVGAGEPGARVGSETARLRGASSLRLWAQRGGKGNTVLCKQGAGGLSGAGGQAAFLPEATAVRAQGRQRATGGGASLPGELHRTSPGVRGPGPAGLGRSRP